MKTTTRYKIHVRFHQICMIVILSVGVRSIGFAQEGPAQPFQPSEETLKYLNALRSWENSLSDEMVTLKSEKDNYTIKLSYPKKGEQSATVNEVVEDSASVPLKYFVVHSLDKSMILMPLSGVSAILSESKEAKGRPTPVTQYLERLLGAAKEVSVASYSTTNILTIKLDYAKQCSLGLRNHTFLPSWSNRLQYETTIRVITDKSGKLVSMIDDIWLHGNKGGKVGVSVDAANPATSGIDFAALLGALQLAQGPNEFTPEGAIEIERALAKQSSQ